MIKAVLFPCEILSICEIDSCYQSEYDAVKKSGEYEIFLYDYEEFVQQGSLHLNRRPEEKTLTVLRGWMLNNIQYENFYNLLLKRNIELITSPEHYANMHLFPRAYPRLVEDTPEILVYPEGRADMEVNLEEIKSKFSRFMVKDFVKSEKNTDFPKFFDSGVTEDEFKDWIKKFKEYRGKLYTGGICIKEYIDLKKYGENTNEWRVFYANEHVLSVSRNSGQKGSVPEVLDSLVEKYRNLPSPFYTVDYAELEDGSWKILEVGDGQVSGLSENQDVDVFLKNLKSFEQNVCLDCQKKIINKKMLCVKCLRGIAEVNSLEGNTIEYKCPACGTKYASTYWTPCEKESDKLIDSEWKHIPGNLREQYISTHRSILHRDKNCPYLNIE